MRFRFGYGICKMSDIIGDFRLFFYLTKDGISVFISYKNECNHFYINNTDKTLMEICEYYKTNLRQAIVDMDMILHSEVYYFLKDELMEFSNGQ